MTMSGSKNLFQFCLIDGEMIIYIYIIVYYNMLRKLFHNFRTKILL